MKINPVWKKANDLLDKHSVAALYIAEDKIEETSGKSQGFWKAVANVIYDLLEDSYYKNEAAGYDCSAIAAAIF